MGYNGVDYFSPEGAYSVSPSNSAGGSRASTDGSNASASSLSQLPSLRMAADQLKCLVDLCHLHGIAVIFDLVYNHAGGGFDDRSIWFYDRQRPDNQNNSLFFTDHGWAGGQIFAYWNDWVSQFLIDNARFFLTEFRIDGIRYDEVRVIENEGGRLFCQHLTDTVRATNPAAIQIAEYWNEDRAERVHPPPRGSASTPSLATVCGMRCVIFSGRHRPVHRRHWIFPLWRTPLWCRLRIPEGWRLVQCLENQDVTFASHSDAARVAMLADSSDRNVLVRPQPKQDGNRPVACRARNSRIVHGPGIPRG